MSCQNWFVYILRCSDNSLYTGITTDLERRLKQHNEGSTGARYTRARRPVALAYVETASDRSEAQRREAAIKRLKPAQKEAVIATSKTPALDDNLVPDTQSVK